MFALPEPFRVVIDVARQPPEAAGRDPRHVLRVTLDPGHGGVDPGATGANGTREKDITLDIAHKVAPALAALGLEVVLTRDDDRTVSFVLRPDVWVYGGFAGTELLLEQRDWVANLTTLSGDIGVAGDHTDNTHHVVVAADNSRLDGFTITGGYSQGAVDRNGVGVRADNVGFVLAHAIVTAKANRGLRFHTRTIAPAMTAAPRLCVSRL